jgi:tetratricopeptide (TPR) repeat protein
MTSFQRIYKSWRFAVAAFFVAAAFMPASARAQTNAAQQDAAADEGDHYTQPDPAKRAEAYFNYAMGHLNEARYLTTSKSEYATAAIDFYKKAYELDPSSQAIAEHLAEMYYQTQRTRDAVLEAQGILQKDPDNLPARRLLARIYLRTLGDMSGAAAQHDVVDRAVQQLEQIRRIDPRDKDSAVWLARLYRVRGENDKAEAVLNDLLKQDSTDPASLEQMAQMLLDENRAEQAVTILEKAMATAPRGGLLDLLGDAYAQLHDFANAEKSYRRSIELEPGEPSHRRGLAQALASEGKYEDALAEYKHLVTMDADDPDNYLRIAEMDRQLRRFDDAEQAIVQAKQRAPGNLEVIYSEAMIYEAQGRFDDAVKVVNAAVDTVKATPAPSNRRTLAILYEQLARLYREMEDNAAAMKALNDLAALGPEESERAALLIIDTYRADRDLTHALDAATRGEAQYPHDRDIHISHALLLGDKGDADAAATELRGLTTHSAQDIDIYLDISQVYLQSHRYQDAETALAQAGKLAEKDSEKEMVEYVLGGVYEREKKFDLAEQAFKHVISIDPHNAAALNYYGYMLADEGVRLVEATEFVKRALAEDPQNGAYLDSLGWVYFKQDKLAEAEDALREAVTREKHDPMIFDHLGDVYFKRGKTDLAATQWERALDEWRHALPTEADPGRVAATENKLAVAKRRIAEQKPKSSGPGGVR